MKTKTELEQMRLIDETPEEKIHRLRQKVADTEELLRSLEKAAKSAKDNLAEFVLANMEVNAFVFSDDNVNKLNDIAANCRGIMLCVMDAKAAVGNAYAELAKVERSR